MEWKMCKVKNNLSAFFSLLLVYLFIFLYTCFQKVYVRFIALSCEKKQDAEKTSFFFLHLLMVDEFHKSQVEYVMRESIFIFENYWKYSILFKFIWRSLNIFCGVIMYSIRHSAIRTVFILTQNIKKEKRKCKKHCQQGFHFSWQHKMEKNTTEKCT